MYRSIVLLLAGILIANVDRPACTVRAQTENITHFYPIADSVASYPDLTAKLAIVCQKKVGKFYVAFVGYDTTKQVFIATVTLDSISDPNRDISRIVEFNGITPSVGRTTTWGYIFDRNGDGKIDYMALIGGAAAIEPDDFPEDFPRRHQRMDDQQAEFFIGHCSLVFDHWADDNFDGTIDAVVHIDMDTSRDWVKRRVVARSTNFDGKLDDVWAFRNHITDGRVDSVSHTKTSVPYRPLGESRDAAIDATAMKEMTELLRIINSAAAKCAIKPELRLDQ